jgi:hypothetical protein
MHRPVAKSQILSVLSSDAKATCIISDDHAIELISSRWPSSIDIHWLVVGSQILTVLSFEADASLDTVGDHDTNLIG